MVQISVRLSLKHYAQPTGSQVNALRNTGQTRQRQTSDTYALHPTFSSYSRLKSSTKSYCAAASALSSLKIKISQTEILGKSTEFKKSTTGINFDPHIKVRCHHYDIIIGLSGKCELFSAKRKFKMRKIPPNFFKNHPKCVKNSFRCPGNQYGHHIFNWEVSVLRQRLSP